MKCIKGLNRHFTKEDIQMANKYMKRFSTSCVINELQIKTTVRFHYIPIIYPLYTYQEWSMAIHFIFLPGESKDRATWWDTIHTIAQSRTWLKRLSSSSIYLLECPKSRILTIPHTVKIGNAHSLLVGMQVVQSFWKTVWQFLTKLNILLLYNPATMLLDIYPK